MPTDLKIEALVKGLSSCFEEEPKAEEELADFLDRVDVAYGNADASLSEDEWQTGLASDEAYNLLSYGSGSEEYWQNIFNHISRRFAPSPATATTNQHDVSAPLSRPVKQDQIPPYLSGDYLSTTETLLREINFDEKGVDRNALVALGEEQTQFLLSQGRQDEAGDLLGNLCAVYHELGDQSGSDFALARAEFLRGNLKEANRLLGTISSSSPLYSFAQELKAEIQPLLQREARLEKVLPHIAVLEQMRMRALEQLAFDESQIHDTWWEPDSWADDERSSKTRTIRKVNQGINEMVQALLDGKVSTVEEAFAHFHEFTDLCKSYEKVELLSGNDFKTLLHNQGKVDVDRLIEFSKVTGQKQREQWLLDYTESLRKNYSSLDGFPANTIERNLQALKQSKDPAIKARAEKLYANVTGDSAITGLSDSAFAELLREGGKETVPMVLAMMIAGPVGAYAEGASAIRLIARGMSLGRAGWTARAAGFGVEATLFWAADDALHATLIGGGDYFTGHGLASSFLMLGGLKVLGAAWGVTGGAYLASAAKSNQALAPMLGGAGKVGQLATEFGGFWGLGQFEELIGLVPKQETALRQELTQTAMTLMQLKMAVAAGQMVTGHLAEIKTLEIKLESTEALLRTAAERRSLTPDQLTRALTHIEGLRTELIRLQEGPKQAPPSGKQPTEKAGRAGTESTPVVSWDDLDIPRDEINALYDAHESLPEEQRTEHGLHRLGEQGVVFSGERNTTDSVILEAGDETGDGLIQPSDFLAHIHGGDPIPSLEDLNILSARARLNRGVPQVHTVFGYQGGKRAFVQVTALFDGTKTDFSFNISENLPTTTLPLLSRKAARLVQFSDRDLQEQAMRPAAQKTAEERVADYEEGLKGLANKDAVNGLSARVSDPIDRVAILEVWHHIWMEYIVSQHPELESALQSLEVSLFVEGGKSRNAKDLKKELNNFVRHCNFLMVEIGLSAPEVNTVVMDIIQKHETTLESVVEGCRLLMQRGLTAENVKSAVLNPENHDICGLAIGIENRGNMARTLHPLLIAQSRDPVTGKFIPVLYRQQARLLFDTVNAVSKFGDQSLSDDFLFRNQHIILNSTLDDATKRARLNASLNDPAFISRGLTSFVNQLMGLTGITEGAKNYLKALQQGMERGDSRYQNEAVSLLIVRNGVSRSLLESLLKNRYCDARFLTPFMREAAVSLKNNGHRPPDFLKNVFENIKSVDNSEALDGYLMELQIFNLTVNHGRLSGTPSSGYLKPDQLPTGIVHETKDPNNPDFVGVTYPDPDRSSSLLTSGLEMDLILPGAPPLSSIEIKRTVKRDDPRQKRQRAKQREATKLGLVSKPGCITSEIDSRLARELIADGTFEYIIVIRENPRNGTYEVLDAYGSNPRIGNTSVRTGTTFPISSSASSSVFPYPL